MKRRGDERKGDETKNRTEGVKLWNKIGQKTVNYKKLAEKLTSIFFRTISCSNSLLLLPRTSRLANKASVSSSTLK